MNRCMPGVVISLTIVAVAAGCGGEPATSGAGAAVVDEVFAELDRAYQELGRPTPSFESMAQVQEKAQEVLSKRWMDWPSGTSYTLSAMPDHVFVFVDVGGEKTEREWRP